MMYQIWKAKEGDTIVRLGDMAFIPCAEDNTDYQQYLAWIAEGNVAEEWEGA